MGFGCPSVTNWPRGSDGQFCSASNPQGLDRNHHAWCLPRTGNPSAPRPGDPRYDLMSKEVGDCGHTVVYRQIAPIRSEPSGNDWPRPSAILKAVHATMAASCTSATSAFPPGPRSVGNTMP